MFCTRKMGVVKIFFFVVAFLLSLLDCPCILAHFSQELLKFVVLYLTVVKTVKPERGSSEIIEHNTNSLLVQNNDGCPMKSFTISPLPQKELTVFKKCLFEGHLVCLYIFCLITMTNQEDSIIKPYTDRNFIHSVYITGLDICRDITASLSI